MVSLEVLPLGLSIQWSLHGHWALITPLTLLFATGESVQRYWNGSEHRRQPVFSIFSQASTAVCRSIRLRV